MNGNGAEIKAVLNTLTPQEDRLLINVYNHLGLQKPVELRPDESHILEAMSPILGANIDGVRFGVVAKANLLLFRGSPSSDIPDLMQHQLDVTYWSLVVAFNLGLSKEEACNILLGGSIHDIGKKYIVEPELIIKPARLDPREVGIVKEHSAVGFEFLRSLGYPDEIAQAALSHHERQAKVVGYPERGPHEKVPDWIKILGAVDFIVGNMEPNRKYHTPLTQPQALLKLSKNSRTVFDPNVTESVIEVLIKQNIVLGKSWEDILALIK